METERGYMTCSNSRNQVEAKLGSNSEFLTLDNLLVPFTHSVVSVQQLYKTLETVS